MSHHYVVVDNMSTTEYRNISSRAHLFEPSRPVPVDNVGIKHNVKHRFYPDSVDKIPVCDADMSIPALDSLIGEKEAPEIEKIKGFIEKQIIFEREVSERSKREKERTAYPNPATECRQPQITHEYQTARLFLSHYGFLSLESLKEPVNSSLPPDLVMLDTTNTAMFTDMEMLDSIPSRDNDTVHIFYIKSSQKTVADILSNVTTQSRVQPQFLEFLHSLGWPVDVRRHAGWTGHVSTSWKTIDSEDVDEDDYQTGTGGSIYDGRQQVLYWADVSSEVAFVVPSPDATYLRSNNTFPDIEKSPTRTTANDRFESYVTKPKSLGLDSNKTGSRSNRESPSSPPEVPSNTGSRGKRYGRQVGQMVGPDTKVYVVWLESFEDHENFPLGEIQNVTSTGQSSYKQTEKDVYIIFIHALQNGLFRLHMQGHEKNSSKMTMAIPLVDGMVVSRRTLGTLVRQTAINICRRKRLESESYQPPHVRRKLQIQDIVNKFRCKMTEAEFFTALFQDVPK